MARLKLRFPDAEAMRAFTATENLDSSSIVLNGKRNYVSVDVHEVTALALSAEGVGAPAETNASLSLMEREYGAEVVEDVQYDLDAEDFDTKLADRSNSTLDDVLTMIKAEGAWEEGRGKGVSIAIVDTGIDGSHREFPASKRAGSWQPLGEQPWTDWQGHGTMCATIAAGTNAKGGRYQGVAPDASLIACKTRFYDSELAAIYDYLAARAENGETIVATNSFGRKVGQAPGPDPYSDFLPALDDAIAAGVIVVFSAGNNHKRVGGRPDQCDPNSVWLYKGRSDLLAVGTCDLSGSMWYYSSRGPGQHFGDPGTARKPDVVAPTPRNGRILYGAGDRVLAEGWGTSGAGPQVAGLAALLKSADPSLDRQRLGNVIRQTAGPLGHGPHCEGSGLIDCAAAMSQVITAKGTPK